MTLHRIPFIIERSIIGKRADAAYLVEGQHDPCEALYEGVIQSISTDIEVTAGGITLHLAAWQDPEHWDEDWASKGITDGRAFIAGLAKVQERA